MITPEMAKEHVTTLPRAWGGTAVSGVLRHHPEDFIVREQLPFEPDGSGEHVMLWVRKRMLNTQDVVTQIARFAGVREMDVGYAGLKDKQACTEQWFSVYLANRSEPDWQALNGADLTVLRHDRHSRKLKRGALSGNRFVITVRDLRGDITLLEQRLHQVRQFGVPNYFGEQRFGIQGNNLLRAQEWLVQGRPLRSGRQQQGMILSAARSYLFNLVLGERVARQYWHRPMEGEVFLLAGSNSFFQSGVLDETLLLRLQQGDILASGPLWGRGRTLAQAQAGDLESAVLAPLQAWCLALEHQGLKQERRALVLPVPDLVWRFQDEQTLILEFALTSGAYATSVLRELVDYYLDRGISA